MEVTESNGTEDTPAHRSVARCLLCSISRAWAGKISPGAMAGDTLLRGTFPDYYKCTGSMNGSLPSRHYLAGLCVVVDMDVSRTDDPHIAVTTIQPGRSTNAPQTPES